MFFHQPTYVRTNSRSGSLDHNLEYPGPEWRADFVSDIRHVRRIEHGITILLISVELVLKLYGESIRSVGGASGIDPQGRRPIGTRCNSRESVVTELVRRPASVQSCRTVTAIRLGRLLSCQGVFDTQPQQTLPVEIEEQTLRVPHTTHH